MTKGWARIERRDTLVAFACALILFVVAVAVSFSTLYGHTPGGGGMLGAPLGDPHTPLFAAILLRNVTVAMGLFTGVLTAGLGSLIGLSFFGFLVGASTAAAATEVGLGPALASVLGYSLIEVLAMLLATTAGLLPSISMLFPSARVAALRPLPRYLAPLPAALVVFGAALVLLVLGAGIETLLIDSRRV